MNRLDGKRRTQVVVALVEGASINSTVRMTGVTKQTILRLIADLGTACAKYQDEALRNLSCKRIQADEVWSFCHAKDKNLSEELKGKFGFGSVWTWTAICADTKLMVSWLVGERSLPYAVKFMDDVASRLAHRVQLTTDGHKPYLQAVEGPLDLRLTMQCLKKSMLPPRMKARQLGTALLNVAGLGRIRLWAARTVGTFQPATLSE